MVVQEQAQGKIDQGVPPQMEGTLRRVGLRYYARCELQMKRKGRPEGHRFGSNRWGKGGRKRGGSSEQEDDVQEDDGKLPTGFLTLLASRQKSTAYKYVITPRLSILIHSIHRIAS